MLRAIGQHRRVAVRSGHKVGKSRLAAAVALWWWSAKQGARVVVTAPTGRQVRKVVWREVVALHRGATQALGGMLHETPNGGLVADDGRDVFGFSADEGEAFSGVSGENVLYIVDEASGVSEAIFEAIEGNRAGGASILMLGNPTQTSGTFYRAFTDDRQAWDTHHISSLEAARYQTEHRALPGLATEEWITEKRRDGWQGTPLWDVRVAGDFPQEGTDVVIGLRLVQEARKRHDEGMDTIPDPLRIGVDVAYFGDDESVIQPRRGPRAYKPSCFRHLDGPALAGKVVQVIRAHRVEGEKIKPRVMVDLIGVGASCFDSLRGLAKTEGFEVVGVNVAESAPTAPEPGDEGFHRLRDELWFRARDWLRNGGQIPDDPKLEADLVAPKFKLPLGRYKVESKDDMKKRLGRSPDRGDALCLAVYEPPQTDMELARAMATW